MNRLSAHLLLYAVGGALWLGAARLPRPAPPTTAASSAFDYAETERRVSFLEAKEAADPGAFGLGLLAQSYLTRFSETGDEADLSRAESAARRSLKIRPNDAAKITLARSLIAGHRFAEAEKVVQGVVGGESVRAECQLETGRYDDALKTLSVAQASSPTDPFLKTLRARLFEIDGENERALQTYRDALKESEKLHGLPAPTRAWLHARLGTALAKNGKPEEAETELSAALEQFPGDWRTLAALARLKACLGDTEKARELARESQQIALSDEAAQLLGEEPGNHRHGRTVALYLADSDKKIDEAVALARADMKSRPSIESYDALAWCLFKAGKTTEAEETMRRALARGTRDASFFYHAGRIFNSSKFLQDALTLNPNFHPTEAENARKLLEKKP